MIAFQMCGKEAMKKKHYWNHQNLTYNPALWFSRNPLRFNMEPSVTCFLQSKQIFLYSSIPQNHKVPQFSPDKGFVADVCQLSSYFPVKLRIYINFDLLCNKNIFLHQYELLFFIICLTQESSTMCHVVAENVYPL